MALRAENYVILEEDEMQAAAVAAASHVSWAIRTKAKPRSAFGDPLDAWGAAIEGYMGEAAFSIFLRAPFAPNLQSFREPDVCGWQVRTTSKPHLKVSTKDADDEPFVHVSGSFGHYEIRGWMLGKDAKRRRFLPRWEVVAVRGAVLLRAVV